MSEGAAKRAKTMPVSQENEIVIIYTMGMTEWDVPEDVTKVVCHPSVTVIEAHTFQGRRKLKEVVLNEGLIKIGEYAFDSCSSLAIIKLPSVTEIGDHAFNHCINLKAVSLNEGLEIIGKWAFMNCKSLTRIRLPSTVTEVQGGAFYGCENLKEIMFNEGLRSIRAYAFMNCYSLTSIRLPSNVTEVGDDAFLQCFNLMEIELNEGLQKIGKKAFAACESLENVKFPNITKRVSNLLEAGYSEIQEKIDNVQRLEWNGDDLLVSAESMSETFVLNLLERPLQGSWYYDWVGTKEHLNKILSLVSYYELKEATSTVELAMWKAKIEEMGAVDSDHRTACRVDVPGPAKDTILQYLK